MKSGDRKNIRALLEQKGTAYPEVVNISNDDLREKINRLIKETAYKAIPDYNPGTSIVEAESGYNTPLNMNGILSLRFRDYFQPESAAHGVSGVSSVTLDLNNGNVFKFKELFRKSLLYKDRIDQIIREQIAVRRIPMLKPFEGVGSREDYYLTPDSLVIYYQPYVYTPGYLGVLEFTIPYAEIEDYINPKGPIGRIRL